MKAGVVTFPGSNCDQDLLYVTREKVGMETVSLWHKDHDLQGCDVIFLPGGFSYGDYLRSGSLARFSPIMEQVIAFAGKGGLVFGICNGFQILCESGLLPGALLHNNQQKFVCENVYITPVTQNSAVTSRTKPGQALKIPIAHGEGRYHADETTLKQLHDNDQILFRYCDANGQIKPESNPNGSIEHIAGVCNKGRNVFGMMPHPERAADTELGNTDGLLILESLLQAVPA
ncbi:MAG: phosphoribosylformylglycinamidine synthase subunit PurQ [Flavobacteriales bacterium]|nr:phosphoribosylformylglycinamidine synthase subunit PurQ [Flavobacteriales bacterium]MCB9449396.1 phosphoribosylformylglycinamidine synthase subunit PurQ [Flavobacteriales bacterium]